MQIRIGERVERDNGTFFHVKAYDDSDQTIMDEYGTWYHLEDCFFDHGLEEDSE